MTLGQVEYAERKALDFFDEWNETTGFVQMDSSYYYELQAVIKDAVHCGIQTALFGKIKKDSEGQIVKSISSIEQETK